MIRRVFLLALALSSTALAQGVSGVKVGNVRLGYLDELDPGWVPVSVPLENPGGETKVQLVATAKGNGVDVWTSDKAVTLPPRSKRVETLYVKVNESVANLELEVLVQGKRINAGSIHAISFRTAASRQRRGQATISLHALLVRDGPKVRELLTWLEPPGTSNTIAAPVELKSEQIEPRELPDRPVGYDGIDMVLLSLTSARDLDEPRRRSLFAWLRNGGRVLLLPGRDSAWFRDELVRALLPSDAETGEVEVPRLENLEKVANASAIPTTACRMYTIKSTSKGVRVGGELVRGKRIPYFTSYKYGAGDVIFTALDLEEDGPLAAWPHAREELGRALHADPATEPVPDRHRTPDDERLAPWFEQALADEEPPSPLYLLPVVLLYLVCMGPLNQRFVRRSSTPVLSIVTIPAISLVFTVVCFVAGYVLRGSKTSIDRLTVIEAHPGEDQAREWAGLRIRSASSTKYTVSSDALLVATPRSWREQSEVEHTRVTQDEGRFAFQDLPLTLWERAFFQARGPFPLGGAVSIENTPSKLTIKNRTTLDLGPGVVFLPGMLGGRRVPPLDHGGEAVLDGSRVGNIQDKSEVLAVIADESQQKVATKALESFATQLKSETTYLALARNVAPSFDVAGRSHPDRELTVFIVQGEDQARAEEVYKYAENVSRERYRDEYDDVIGMLGAIPPSSQSYRDAQKLRAFIATEKYVESAREAFETGDLDKARKMVLETLELPDLDRDSVREIRSRLEKWTALAKAFEDACDLEVQPDLDPAEKAFKTVVEGGSPNDAWTEGAKQRLRAIDYMAGQGGRSAGGSSAISEGRYPEALITLTVGASQGVDVSGTLTEAKSERLLDQARKLTRTALGRIRALEIARLVALTCSDAEEHAQALELERDLVSGRSPK